MEVYLDNSATTRVIRKWEILVYILCVRIMGIRRLCTEKV